MKKSLLPLLLCVATSAFAQNYARLDSTFNGNGRIVLDSPIQTLPQVYAKHALQPDGKIVICGNRITGLFTSAATVTRVKANGTLDSTFGTNGTWAYSVMLGGQNMAIGVAVQPDGKIVAGGMANNGTDTGKLFVVRLNSNGTLDNTFAGTGVGQYDQHDLADKDERVTDMKLQSNGKILLCGIASGTSSSDSGFIVRVNANGTLDATFAGSGIFRYQHAGEMTNLYAVDADSTGRVVAGGSYYSGSNVYQDYVVLRLTSAGVLDNTFGAGGVFTNDHFGDYDEIHSLRLLSNGAVIAAGYSYNGNNDGITAIKLTAAGLLDATFGTGGRTYVGDSTLPMRGYGVALQPDGKVVIGGSMPDANFSYDFVLLRLTTAGQPDTSFRPGTGYLTTNFYGDDDQAASVSIQPDGKILAYGVTVRNTATFDDQPVLARYVTTVTATPPPAAVAAFAENSHGVRLYPSPVRGNQLNIAMGQGRSYDASLYSQTGVLVQKTRLAAADRTIALSTALADGVYFLVLKDADDASISRHTVVVQRD